jgi:hypothetical protein
MLPADLPVRLSEALVLALQSGLCLGHRRCGIGLKVRSFTGSAGSDAGVRLINTETPTGILAHMWFNLAASQESKIGRKNRDRLAKKMTPAQIAEAQKLARDWKPTN